MKPELPTLQTLPTPPFIPLKVEAANAVRNAVSPARDARLPKEAPNIESAVNLSQQEVQATKIQGFVSADPFIEENDSGYAVIPESHSNNNRNNVEAQKQGHTTDIQHISTSAEYDYSKMSTVGIADEALDKKVDKAIAEALDKKVDKAIAEALDSSRLWKKAKDFLWKKAKDFLWKKAKDFLWKKMLEFLKKSISPALITLALYLGTPPDNGIMIADSPKNAPVTCVIYDSAPESTTSPVAVALKQPDLRADKNSTPIYRVCYIVQK